MSTAPHGGARSFSDDSLPLRYSATLGVILTSCEGPSSKRTLFVAHLNRRYETHNHTKRMAPAVWTAKHCRSPIIWNAARLHSSVSGTSAARNQFSYSRTGPDYLKVKGNRRMGGSKVVGL